jgi:hypothetical protein
MSKSRPSHLARSFVVFLAAALVLAGAGFAAARTVGGPPWALPLPSDSCDPAGTTGTVTSPTTDDTTQVDASETEDESENESTETEDPTATETESPTDTETDSPTETESPTATETESPTESESRPPVNCSPAGGDDHAKQAKEAQALFDSLGQCSSAVLDDAKVTGAGGDPATAEAFSSLGEALNSGRVDHMVQSVRVLLRNCQAHSNDGLANALYHHGLSWARHYAHEVWLEQKFADKWPNGKPGGGHDAGHESGPKTTHGKPDKGGRSEKAHGNPHEADPSWAPGGGSSGGHGNAYGHSK